MLLLEPKPLHKLCQSLQFLHSSSVTSRASLTCCSRR